MADSKKHFLAEIEEQMLAVWASERTFEKSLEQRAKAQVFSFYDGPPFANGLPHYGHVLQTTIKDAVTRYKTMQGYYVPRRVGWDTHGLPVEYAIEKQHDFHSKKDIIAYGMDKFNEECRASVFMYKDVWEKMFNRVGRWADFERTYATLDESYIESVWWVFKSIYDKGLVYKDFRSSPYCPRCATPLSNFELNQGYKDDVPDPSLFVKFKLVGEDVSLLAWTTTPWSLPGNAAIAVRPDAPYVYVDVSDDDGQKETLIMARNRLEALNVETYHIVKEVQGSELVGKTYDPLFGLKGIDTYDYSKNLYKVWAAEFVSIDDGSGVLHVAPAFGEDDLLLGKQQNIPILITIDENGHVKSDLGLPETIAGKFFKQADKPVIAYLTEESKVYAAETFLHTYPFCWRCDTPLLYYATDSWLVKVTEVKDQLINNNEHINWTPGHIKQGRFGKWLDNARDWAISRNRFWGAPLPVWVTDDGEIIVIGSLEELRARAIDSAIIGDLHRPYIDNVQIMTDSGKIARRIPEVFDCWFESGSMPYAQDHYPFEHKEEWEQRYPADFIAEAIDQTRGWFYTLHVLATALFDKPAFQNVICSGWIVAADGEKLSKRKKNYAPMDEIFDQYGVDSLRFFMAGSPLVNGEDTRFSVDYLRDVQRKIFMTLNNVFSFYKLYADVDGWKPSEPLVEPQSDNLLDQWMLARLNQTIGEVTAAMDIFRLDKATKPLSDLLDDTSNWFVRRSRRRFWKSENDGDKQQAYATLHYTLLRISQLLCPFSPFLPDYLWRELVEGTALPSSVHLSDWPVFKQVKQDSILSDMEWARSVINEGLAQRASAKIKVRQPLQKVTLLTPHNDLEGYEQIIADELNVKEVQFYDNKTKKPQSTEVEKQHAFDASQHGVVLDTTLTASLRSEGIMREIVRNIQNARKQAGLDINDRIDLRLQSKDKIVEAAFTSPQLSKIIRQETLAVSVNDAVFVDEHVYNVTVGNAELAITLKKTSTN